MKKVPALIPALLAKALTANTQISVPTRKYALIAANSFDVISDFIYDPVNKAITFHLKGNETIQLTLLPKAVLVKNSNDSLVINSVNEFPQK